MMVRVLGLATVALLLVAACGDDEDDPRCVAGEVRSCLCADDFTLAQQTCNPDERSHSACGPCPLGSGGSGGAGGGSGGAGGGSGGAG